MTAVNPVNQQPSPFNAQGELFNSNTVITRPTHFAQAIAVTALPGLPTRPVRPRVLTQLEGEATTVVTDTPAIPTRRSTGLLVPDTSRCHQCSKTCRRCLCPVPSA